MFKIYIILILIFAYYALCQNGNNSGKPYYFRMGKSKNEFRVSNRVYYLNHNITDYDYTHKKNDNIQLQRSNGWNSHNYDSNYFIDEEWNFDHRNIVKNELPLFINKFYEKLSSDVDGLQTTTRILFNTNRNNDIIKFNLESLKINETVLDADFYFFWPLEADSEIFRESVVLRLYQFERHVQAFNESTLIENPDIHKLFNVIYISKAQKGWQIFKIKKPIDNWLNGEDNLGLLLTISSYDDNKLISVFNDTNEGVYSSFAVITVQNNETVSTEQSVIYKDPQSNTPSCQKKEWIVSFKNLHWDDFIIAPNGYMSHDCVGKCLNSESDNLNHVKLLRVFNKRPSCCVPVDYSSLPVMFYDRWSNIVIKNYENMIVTKCGCR